jgi:hypothetical protein
MRHHKAQKCLCKTDRFVEDEQSQNEDICGTI